MQRDSPRESRFFIDYDHNTEQVMPTKIKIIDFNLAANLTREISNPEAISKGKFTDDGVYSDKIYGPHDMASYYMCACGATTGAFNNGTRCEECNTQVQLVNLLDRTGWIDLADNYVIHPMLYIQLENLIGKRQLDKILKLNYRIDKNGNPIIEQPKTNTGKKVDYYNGIGMVGFYERFTEVVDYFARIHARKTDKFAAYRVLYDNWSKIWINKLPVTTRIMRPVMISEDKVFYDDINKHYMYILNHLEKLKRYPELTNRNLKNIQLNIIQTNIMEIFEKTMKRMSSKRGFFRREMAGTRINYVARTVIVPSSASAKINELEIPFIVFMELWQMQIIYHITQVYRCSYREALTRWFHARMKPTPDVIGIIRSLVNAPEGCWVLFNRNPSINIGSILRMRIGSVREDTDNITTGVPVNILTMMGADFDGDTNNIIALFEPWLIKATEKLDPRYMIISRNIAHRCNAEMMPERDTVVGLNSCGGIL